VDVFVTGASGYIGRHVCAALLRGGHRVSGLARSADSARRLAMHGVRSVSGDLTAPASVTGPAAGADAVVHIPMSHDFGAGEDTDVALTNALLSTLAGSGRPFVYTSGTRVYGDTVGRLVTESDPVNPPASLRTRAAVEREVLAAGDQGVRSIVLRPTLTYGDAGSAAMVFLINDALSEGAARYVGDGHNAWSFVHVEDLADLYVRALDAAPAGTLVNGAAGDPIPLRTLAEAIAQTMEPPAPVVSLPVEEALASWGEMGDFLRTDMRISGAFAEERLGWKPRTDTVLDDVREGSYRQALRG
jgi:nucleoside-diphosphate-sugar epimerase